MTEDLTLSDILREHFKNELTEGVAQLYHKRFVLGVERGHDQRLRLKETTHGDVQIISREITEGAV